MNNLSVIEITEEFIKFENGIELYSIHDTVCCESHYLYFKDLTIDDFKDLKFNLSEDKFFKRIENYGIELIPIKGHSVKIPGYGCNNGYYSEELALVIGKDKKVIKTYDISECQVISD